MRLDHTTIRLPTGAKVLTREGKDGSLTVLGIHARREDAVKAEKAARRDAAEPDKLATFVVKKRSLAPMDL